MEDLWPHEIQKAMGPWPLRQVKVKNTAYAVVNKAVIYLSSDTLPFLCAGGQLPFYDDLYMHHPCSVGCRDTLLSDDQNFRLPAPL